MSLKGKTLLITGSSRGIGLAIALQAARDGANVIVAAKTVHPHPHLPGTIYTAAEAIEAAGGRALPLPLDVRDAEAIKQVIGAGAAHFSGIDICVNNAAAINLAQSFGYRHQEDGPAARYQCSWNPACFMSLRALPARGDQSPYFIAVSTIADAR